MKSLKFLPALMVGLLIMLAPSVASAGGTGVCQGQFHCPPPAPPTTVAPSTTAAPPETTVAPPETTVAAPETTVASATTVAANPTTTLVQTTTTVVVVPAVVVSAPQGSDSGPVATTPAPAPAEATSAPQPNANTQSSAKSTVGAVSQEAVSKAGSPAPVVTALPSPPVLDPSPVVLPPVVNIATPSTMVGPAKASGTSGMVLLFGVGVTLVTSVATALSAKASKASKNQAPSAVVVEAPPHSDDVSVEPTETLGVTPMPPVAAAAKNTEYSADELFEAWFLKILDEDFNAPAVESPAPLGAKSLVG